ncbi:hypothetical protein ACOMHN_055803 [Nucella lapillus]
MDNQYLLPLPVQVDPKVAFPRKSQPKVGCDVGVSHHTRVPHGHAITVLHGASTKVDTGASTKVDTGASTKVDTASPLSTSLVAGCDSAVDSENICQKKKEK